MVKTNLVQTTRLIFRVAKRRKISKYKMAEVIGTARTYFNNAEEKGIAYPYIGKLKKFLRIKKRDFHIALKADFEGKDLDELWSKEYEEEYVPFAEYKRCSYCGQIKDKAHRRRHRESLSYVPKKKG